MTSWLGSIGLALHLWHPTTGCAAFSPGGELPTIVADEWQENTTSLCNDGYAVLASGVTHGPLWSAEHVTRAALVELPFTPRMGTFHPDYRLPVTQRATLTDYVDSGYDRGHMTPSGDAADPAEQQDTFLLSNVVPQTPALNRHAWQHIERQVRAIAAHYGDAYVVTGVPPADCETPI